MLTFWYPRTIEREPLSAKFKKFRHKQVNIHLNRKNNNIPPPFSKHQIYLGCFCDNTVRYRLDFYLHFHSQKRPSRKQKSFFSKSCYYIRYFETKVLLLIIMNTSFGGVSRALVRNGKKLLRSYPFPVSFLQKVYYAKHWTSITKVCTSDLQK